MISNNRIKTNQPTLYNALQASEYNVVKNKLNCVRIGVVDEFDAETLVAKIQLVTKLTIGVNNDGSLKVVDYPPIFAKVHYLGWGTTGVTFPITKGMEGIVLFSDREIESWFISGEITPPAYDRNHSFSDAIFICGIHSLPNMIQLAESCLNLFYGTTNIQLSDTGITANGNVTQTGDITSSGTITGASIVDTSGATGSLIDSDGKVLATVVNGIIKSIN